MPELPEHMIHPEQWAYLAYQETINTRETVMAEIDRLETIIKTEVGEALATMQQQVDDALAEAGASREQRDTISAAFDTYRGRVDGLADRVEAEGLFGQDEPGTTTTEPPQQ